MNERENVSLCLEVSHGRVLQNRSNPGVELSRRPCNDEAGLSRKPTNPSLLVVVATSRADEQGGSFYGFGQFRLKRPTAYRPFLRRWAAYFLQVCAYLPEGGEFAGVGGDAR